MITQAICNSFKLELLDGVHDLNADTFKIALYTSAATLNASTTVYSTTNEVVGTNYVAGGINLTMPALTLDGNTAIADFADAIYNNVALTARGALIYNSSKMNKAVAVLDFGSDRTVNNGDFNVIFPAPTAMLGLIRIS